MLRSSGFTLSTYTKRLIKQHVGYFIALLFFIGLFILFIPLQVNQYLELRKQVKNTNNEISTMNIRRDAIQSYSAEDLNELVLVLNTLYPSIEDRFSIFTAVDNLQAVTGMEIETYSSPFSGRSVNEISIAVKGKSDMNTFRRFLQSHVFKSGRFMTLERVSFDVENSSVSFTAIFHSLNVDIGEKTITDFDPNVIERLRLIKAEVESAGFVQPVVPSSDAEIPTDYNTRENPFE